jgi:hypothetical protein
MPYALCPMPYALCPMPYALNPTPYTQHPPTLSTLHPTPYTYHPTQVRRLFSKDPYGCDGRGLGKKRESRDPFNLGQPYLCSSPDLGGLMRHCEGRGGGGRAYTGDLPW